MINDFNDTLESEEGEKRTVSPSLCQKQYARTIEKHSESKLTEEILSDMRKLSIWIEQNKDCVPPPENQISFAKDLCEEKGLDIPDCALHSEASLSEWIQKAMSI